MRCKSASFVASRYPIPIMCLLRGKKATTGSMRREAFPKTPIPDTSSHGFYPKSAAMAACFGIFTKLPGGMWGCMTSADFRYKNHAGDLFERKNKTRRVNAASQIQPSIHRLRGQFISIHPPFIIHLIYLSTLDLLSRTIHFSPSTNCPTWTHSNTMPTQAA